MTSLPWRVVIGRLGRLGHGELKGEQVQEQRRLGRARTVAPGPRVMTVTVIYMEG